MNSDQRERFTWPVPDADTLRQELAEGEAATINYRVERGSFLWAEFGPPADAFLISGIPSMFALDELKRSFIYGNFMATVMLCQAFAEMSLGGMYSLSGNDTIAKKGFKALIEQASTDGHIPATLAAKLHALRTVRNPYLHSNYQGYLNRLRDARSAPEDLVVEDAKEAIRTVVDYLRHNSPGWHPQSHQT
jgi:hypothetical protein